MKAINLLFQALFTIRLGMYIVFPIYSWGAFGSFESYYALGPAGFTIFFALGLYILFGIYKLFLKRLYKVSFNKPKTIMRTFAVSFILDLIMLGFGISGLFGY